MAKTTAEWSGVIVVGSFELDCRLFGATGRAKPLPLKMVHIDCKTVLEEKAAEPEAAEPIEEEKKPEPEAAAPIEAREQIFCPKCQKALKSDEIGRGIETAVGTILLLEAELKSLEFEPAKRVTAELIAADDPTLTATGFGRRLYVMPKPAAVRAWDQVFHVLKESQRVGFINPIVIKRKANVGILRPLVVPAVVFGEERAILVLDMLNDTDCLKDPASVPDYPRTLPPVNVAELAKPIADAQAATDGLNPERCVNPKRIQIKRVLRQAMERSLRK